MFPVFRNRAGTAMISELALDMVLGLVAVLMALPMLTSPLIAIWAMRLERDQAAGLFTSSGMPSQAKENWQELRRCEPW